VSAPFLAAFPNRKTGYHFFWKRSLFLPGGGQQKSRLEGRAAAFGFWSSLWDQIKRT